MANPSPGGRGRVREIGTDKRLVSFNGDPLSYDYLVVATGAIGHAHEIDGPAERGAGIGTLGDMIFLRQELRRVVADAANGRRPKILFLATRGSRWPAPLYEIALMTEMCLRRQGLRDQAEIAFATAEKGYLAMFGSEVSAPVAREFAARASTTTCSCTHPR